MITFNGQPLFEQESAELEKTGSLMSKTPDSWEAQILDELHEQHPYLAAHRIDVDMRKSDAESGHGVGAVKIAEMATIPVIIDSYRLQPLDFFFDKEGEMHALSRASLESAIQTRDLGEPQKPNKGGAQSDAGISHRVLPPFDGKYAFASVIEHSRGDLEDLLSTLTEEELQKAAQDADFTAVVSGYAQTCFTPEDLREDAQILDRNNFGQVSSGGVYKVASARGYRTALVTDRTFYFGPGVESATRTALSLDKEAGLATGAEVYGESVQADGGLRGIEEGRGIFLNMTGDSVVGTEVVKVASGKLTTETGAEYNLIKSAHVDNGIVVADRTVYMSPDWRLVAVDSDMELTKSASACDNASGDYAAITDLGGRYRVSDANTFGLDKIAEREGVTKEELYPALAERLSTSSIAKIAEALSDQDYVEFVIPVQEVEKIAAAPQLDTNQKADLVSAALTVALCKTAAVEGDKAQKTVDAVLGLGFLSDENVLKFVNMVPDLEEAKQHIAHLLMGSRLGLEISSGPLRSAMHSLDTIIRDLKELRNNAVVR
jgi:hypothetical protein